jgi:hypothetical protein
VPPDAGKDNDDDRSAFYRSRPCTDETKAKASGILVRIRIPCNLHSSPSIIRMIKSRRMRWAGHAAEIEGKEECV